MKYQPKILPWHVAPAFKLYMQDKYMNNVKQVEPSRKLASGNVGFDLIKCFAKAKSGGITVEAAAVEHLAVRLSHPVSAPITWYTKS